MPTLQRGALKRRASGRSISATSSIISGPYFSTGHLPKSITMYDDGDMINPAAKSVLATSAFSLAGIISVLFYSVVSPFLLPHSIIYALLVLNTYFSIRFWSALQPQDSRQFLIDAILVLAYLALAFSMGEPAYFAFAALPLGLFLGYALEATWIFAIGFALANVYLLLIKPMYRLSP